MINQLWRLTVHKVTTPHSVGRSMTQELFSSCIYQEYNSEEVNQCKPKQEKKAYVWLHPEARYMYLDIGCIAGSLNDSNPSKCNVVCSHVFKHRVYFVLHHKLVPEVLQVKHFKMLQAPHYTSTFMFLSKRTNLYMCSSTVLGHLKLHRVYDFYRGIT